MISLPNVLYVTVAVEASHALRLGFTAWENVGFGCQGEAVVQKQHGNQFHKYQIQQGSSYEEIWNKTFTPHFEKGGMTAISSTGVILVQDIKNRGTYGYTPEGEAFNGWPHEGLFLTCVPTATLNFVYRRRLGYENYFVFLL